jgi:hypothetical protein
VFLPPDYTYGDFAGTMTREIGVAVPEASSFSSLDYKHRESQVKAEMAKEQKDDIISAKRKLSAGKVREAYFDYSRARAKGDLSQVPADEAKRLEEDLRRAQGSNLVMAQNEFNLENNMIAGRAVQLVQNVQKQAYSVEAAEAQWAKLQQAQDLGGAQAQPIHVNLPTRGLRFTFTQVLQAEAGKPMTIEMAASNDKQGGWTYRLALGVAGFLVIWGLTSLLVRFTPSRGTRLAQA